MLTLALVPFVEHGLWMFATELFDASLPLCLRSALVSMPLRVAAVPPYPSLQPTFAEQALSAVVLALLDSLLLWWSWSRLL